MGEKIIFVCTDDDDNIGTQALVAMKLDYEDDNIIITKEAYY